ncbi:MAG: SHOCT domain-containing protein [Desulfitobacteriaceae bacterium]|nr:SHOCT domain-containing protein [Desulfitobacteriaceae bacterium]MDI6915612.1 SHOCT domain-containing protein [Desulfitobacteriaceae bacterium]
MFIILILLVIGAIYLFQNQQSSVFSEHQQYLRDHSRDALYILRERYTRGEIESEEYDRRKHDLSMK